MTEITLDMLLASRDQRHQIQMELISQHPDKTLVCITVIMPGRVKRNRQSLTIAKAAIEAMKQAFLVHSTLLERDLMTGYEAYLLTTLSQTAAKRIACNTEEQHPLGRLFDIDIIDDQGVPVSRESIGFSPRRCLLCENEARYCMRNHTHTPEEIWQRILEMTDSYERSNPSLSLTHV